MNRTRTLPLWLACLLLALPLFAQTPPTLITTPGQPHVTPPVLVGTAAVRVPALGYTSVFTGGGTVIRSVTIPAGQPALGPNPLSCVGGTLSNQVVTRLADGSQKVTFSISIRADKGTKGIVSVTALPNIKPAQFFDTGSFDHSLPPGSRTITSANKGNVFIGGTPADCHPVLTFTNADSKVIAYKVLTKSGLIAAAGTVPAGASSVSPSLSQFGPYTIYALGAVSQGQYGAVLGSTIFGLAPPTPAGVNLPGLPSKSAYISSQPFFDADAAMWGYVQAGPDRYNILNAAAAGSELANLLTNLNAQKQYYVTGQDGGVADPVRGRPTFVNSPYFHNGAGEAAGVTAAVSALYAQGVTYFEGPNEPAPSPSSIPVARAFYAAVKAGNPAAQVIGPAFVSATGGLNSFLAACNGDYPFDELSFHAYNAVNGDYDMAERQMSLQESILTKYGLQNRRRWQTEQAYHGPLKGLNSPTRPVAWQIAQTLVFERHHQPVETNYVWHHKANGDWDFPVWTENSDGSLNGVGYFFRQFVTQTWAKPFASAYDFGPANALWYADRFDGQGPESGKSVSVFACKQTKGERLTLSLSGPTIPASVVVSDTYGNPTTLSVTNNQVTLPATTGPDWLCYVPHASTLTLTPVGTDWGANLALTASVQTPTNQAYASRITNGVWENQYDYTARVFGSDATWMASTSQQGNVGAAQTYPYILTLDLNPIGKANVTFQRLVIGGPPMWQNMSSITSAQIYVGTSAGINHVDANSGVVLTGTAFADPSGANGGAGSPDAVFDGNTATSYESSAANGYVGLELAQAAPINQVKCAFQPFFGTIKGSVIEGSNTSATAGYVTLGTFTKNATEGLTNVVNIASRTPYKWYRYNDKNGNHVRLTEMQIVSGIVKETVSTSGAWSYKAAIGQTAPLMEIFSDEGTTATQATDYTPQVARWNVVFPAPVTARFIKISVYGATSGGAGSALGALYGGQAGPSMVTLGEVQAFGQ